MNTQSIPLNRSFLAMPSENGSPKFPKPKILLVDLPDGAATRLSEGGFNVRKGTFGRPYRVKDNTGYIPVFAQGWLPNHTEQEIVIIDLTPPESADRPSQNYRIQDHFQYIHAIAGTGLIDPRPIEMIQATDGWMRVLDSGGFFVVFAQARNPKSMTMARYINGRSYDHSELPFDNWSFLPILGPKWLDVLRDHGTESLLTESVNTIEQFFRSHQDGLEFFATLSPTYEMNSYNCQYQFFSLFQNKFGNCIGARIVHKTRGGQILILPQFQDKDRAVYELVTTVLPELGLHLFPDFEGGRWVQSEEYEHPAILDRKAKQSHLREEAAVKIAELDREIMTERERLIFLHGILTKTGDDLVPDVRDALGVVGFSKIETPAEEDGPNKQEDLQIHDRPRILIVEIKGISGQPTESDTQQVTKYVVRRMKQWNNTEVSGVFLVNHQRNLPPLQRDHDNVFTSQQVDDAIANGTGLITTWDLFRLIRGRTRWGWPATGSSPANAPMT